MGLAQEWQRVSQLRRQQLELSEAGSWPLLLRMMVLVLAFVISLVGARVLLVEPQQQALHAARVREEQLLDSYRRLSWEIAGRERLERRTRKLGEQWEMLWKPVQNMTAPSLMEQVGELAAEHDLKVETLALEGKAAGSMEGSLDLKLSGDYHRIAEFVVSLTSMPVNVTLRDMQLIRHDQSLEMTARIEIFRAVSPANDALGRTVGPEESSS